MPLLLALIALIFPRFVIFLLWLASSWFTGVFETRLWPLLGFFFLPLTLLWYSVVTNWFGGTWGWWQIIVLILAILLDLRSDKETAR
jgi:hypothetical protein